MSADQEPLVSRDMYDDPFVAIDGTTNTLTLKRYLLAKPTRNVHIPDLLYVRPASETITRIGLKARSLSPSGIIWALDWHRGNAITGPRSGFKSSFVIKVRGDWLRMGFSVKDPDRFFEVLERIRLG